MNTKVTVKCSSGPNHIIVLDIEELEIADTGGVPFKVSRDAAGKWAIEGAPTSLSVLDPEVELDMKALNSAIFYSFRDTESTDPIERKRVSFERNLVAKEIDVSRRSNGEYNVSEVQNEWVRFSLMNTD